jgi:hypothetical protein
MFPKIEPINRGWKVCCVFKSLTRLQTAVVDKLAHTVWLGGALGNVSSNMSEQKSSMNLLPIHLFESCTVVFLILPP